LSPESRSQAIPLISCVNIDMFEQQSPNKSGQSRKTKHMILILALKRTADYITYTHAPRMHKHTHTHTVMTLEMENPQ